MAKTLKFVRGSTELNLLTIENGLELQGWSPKVATPLAGRVPNPVIETMAIRVTGATQDDLATKVQALHDMQRWADAYINDSAETNPVWLVAQQVNETNQRRALIRKIQVAFDSGWFGTFGDSSNMADVVLAVEREPYWEAVSELTMQNDITPTAAASVVYDYTGGAAADIVGDVGARIGSLKLEDSSANALGRVWIGLRSANKHGTLANFVPVWECEDTDATLGTDAARTTDATASPGGAGNTKVRVTPGTATWANRLSIAIGNVTANLSDNYGRFLWLLRYQVSAGTWEIQLRYGYASMADADLVQGPIVSVNSTSWDYAEMGVVEIPFMDPWVPSGEVRPVDIQYSFVAIFARRTSGVGTLDIDCLCPIPVDEGFLKVGAFNSSVNPGAMIWYHDSPRGPNIEAYDGAVYQAPPTHMNNFYLPPGDGRMIIVIARNASTDFTDDVRINRVVQGSIGHYYPRWLSLRGSE